MFNSKLNKSLSNVLPHVRGGDEHPKPQAINSVADRDSAGVRHPLMPQRGPNLTKIERLRRHFLARTNTWIPMPELVRVSGSYVIHSGAATLRKRYGMVIDCERKERIDAGQMIEVWEYRYRPDYRYLFVETPEGARKRAAVPKGSIVESSTIKGGQ